MYQQSSKVCGSIAKLAGKRASFEVDSPSKVCGTQTFSGLCATVRGVGFFQMLPDVLCVKEIAD